MSTDSILFKNISKTYANGTHALKNINLEIQAGSFTFFMGPTGSGKSTLLKLLLKEEQPTSGQITVFGKDLKKLANKEIPLMRQKTGTIFQDFKLLPQKTVWENVAFALDILGMAKKEQHKHVKRVLEITGIYGVRKAYPHQLSGGEQQRVSLARAIIHNPPLLLADEPTGNLDPDTSLKIIQLLLKINKTGTTVLVSTHDPAIVQKAQKRVVRMLKGQIVEDTDYV